MKKSVLNSAIMTAMGLGAVGAAHAAPVAFTGLNLTDVGSNTANAVNSMSTVLDGQVGSFLFQSTYLNVKNYMGGTPFTGDVASGTIFGGGAANSTGSFTTGFIFSGAPFVPYTFGSGFAGTIDDTTDALSITSLSFGGQFQSGPPASWAPFNLPPDANTLQVLWTDRVNSTDVNVAFRWSHDITSTEDPSLMYSSFTGQWVLEGCLTTSGDGKCAEAAVPVPAAVWLFGSGLVGLAGVARRRKGQKA